MNAITATLADSIDADLSNVLPFKQPDPETEVERLADLHRRMVAKYSQRSADTRKALKAKIAGLEGDRRSLRSRFERDMAFIVEQIADAKDKAQRDTEADTKLVAASRAALETLSAS